MLNFVEAFFISTFGAPKERERERGASAVEYGLLIAGIAAVIVVGVFAFGTAIQEVFADTSAKISTPPGETCVGEDC